jgi:hypothetical protein
MRPVSITVFGVLNIVFGLFGLLTTGMLVAAMAMRGLVATPQPNGQAEFVNSPAYAYWVKFSLVSGPLSAIALTAAGIGLLLLKPWARTLSIAFAAYSILSAIVGTVFTWVYVIKPLTELDPDGRSVQAMAAMFGLIGGCPSHIYPVLLWYFMTRPRVVAAFHGQLAPPVEAGSAPVPSTAPTVDPANPFAAPQVDTASSWQPAGETGSSVAETAQNGPALAAFYLGLFSLLPCLGFPLAIAAIYFGWQGLAHFKANPRVRGDMQARVGIACGILFGLFNLALVALAIIGTVSAAMHS